ncbi:LysR family transcriptional regulator [Pseudogemmobacter bohemicus]|uniref:LysR family transcriptional regulator n=1 Tax=Pseudogemmobacter bohemicus TaxID=2250708 RepID=UPI000DD325B2|nr:LysR family transcriptional regulator [Pseudogemmobacter bohemicus]
MDWDDLRIFLEVARHESLSGAGKRLKIDAATVGRRVQRFEDALGQRLFARSPQGYQLSPAGERLLPAAERAEAAMLAAGEALSDDRAGQGLTGLIRLGAPDGCANYLLPPVIAHICEHNPGLEVQLVALPRVFNLSKREADMAIGVSRPETGRLTVQKLTDYRLVLAASEAWLARNPAPVSRADLRDLRFVGYIPDLIFDKELDYLAELGAPQVAISSNSVSVQLNFLRQGAGIGIVHDFALPAAPELRQILPDEVGLTRSFWLIRHADDGRVQRLNRFAQSLVRETKAEMARHENTAPPGGYNLKA